jgi:hypothetical protein
MHNKSILGRVPQVLSTTNKMGIYEEPLKDYIFVPVAVETFGSGEPIGLNFNKDIGRKIREKTGKKNATSHIK